MTQQPAAPDYIRYVTLGDSATYGLGDRGATSGAAGRDPERIRADLLHSAAALAHSGALLAIVHFHDHSKVFGGPSPSGAPHGPADRRLNEIYDEVHERYGVIRVDLSSDQVTGHRVFWSADRLHPSELGHRHLARRAASLLNQEGLLFDVSSEPGARTATTKRETVCILAKEGGPWIARRAKEPRLTTMVSHKFTHNPAGPFDGSARGRTSIQS